MSDEHIDHRTMAVTALANAEGALEYHDSKEAAAGLYAQLGIGHALMCIADALDRIGDDLDEIKRR
jgi:hypothetical protein